MDWICDTGVPCIFAGISLWMFFNAFLILVAFGFNDDDLA